MRCVFDLCYNIRYASVDLHGEPLVCVYNNLVPLSLLFVASVSLSLFSVEGCRTQSTDGYKTKGCIQHGQHCASKCKLVEL